MPRDFPDMASLVGAARRHKFREPVEGESEAIYRMQLADHVQPIDQVESLEIRNKVGWDKQHPLQMMAQLLQGTKQ